MITRIKNSSSTLLILFAALFVAAPPVASQNADSLIGDKQTSAANGKIVFVGSIENGGSNIYTINPGGSGLQRLTSNTTDANARPTFNINPVWSSVNQRIAFASNRDGIYQIYTMNADGSDVTQLTVSATNKANPDWSPDGRRIVFSATTVQQSESESDIYIVNADGSNETRLTTERGPDITPAWSPDGTKIAFSSFRDGSTSNLYVMNPDGGNQRLLYGATDGANNANPAWSPDGTKILFDVVRVCVLPCSEIWIVNSDGGGARRLPDIPTYSGGAAWSPDGNLIVFSGQENVTNRSPSRLYIVNADGTNRRQLGNDTIQGGDTDWGSFPPGSTTNRRGNVNGKITFESGRNPDSSNLDIYVMNPNGSDVTQLTRSDRSNAPGSVLANFGAVWSPDGTRIAFTRQIRQGDDQIFNQEVFVMNANGGNQINLSNHPATDENPVWSPDGTRIAFASYRDGKAGIYVVNIDGTNLRRLTQDGVGNCGLDWSPDGTKIAFADGYCGAHIGMPPPPPDLYVINADGGEQRKIADNAGAPLWSPDSTRILFANTSGIYVVNADGTNRTTLTTKEDGGGISPTWSPDGSAIAFVSFRSDARGGSGGGIYKIKPDGSGLTKLTDARSSGATADYSPEWSPDSTKIAFMRQLKIDENRSNGEIFVMNADGTNQIRVTNHPDYDYAPKWQPLSAGATPAPPAGSIYFKFDSDPFIVSESVGSATVTVTRKGGADGKGDLDREAVIDYTADSMAPQQGGGICDYYFRNLATRNLDYTPTRGTLRFAPGEVQKSFQVAIVNDSENEGEELETIPVFLNVSTAGGATSNAEKICYEDLALLRIIDDEAVPSGSSVGFDSVKHYVQENGTRVLLTLRRSGDLSGSASVNYATFDRAADAKCDISNGAASARCDYMEKIDTLRFAPGEAVQTISVSIVDDSHAEGDETFSVRITGATGVGFGAQREATVVIVGRGTHPGVSNSIDSAYYFVRQQYLDFLGREPDGPGWNHWMNEITQCADASLRRAGETEERCIDRKRTNTSGAFFVSLEHQATGYYVYRLYQGSLNRAPLLAEYLPDVADVARGIVANNALVPEVIERNKDEFARRFTERSEFRRQYDNLTNAEYVDRLIQTTTIALTAEERAELIGGLDRGTETRASVLRKIVDGTRVELSDGKAKQIFTTRYGQAFYDRQFNRAFVHMQYFGYLRRDPDAEGYQFWLAKLNRFGNFVDAEMVRAFIISAEYRARFGQP